MLAAMCIMMTSSAALGTTAGKDRAGTAMAEVHARLSYREALDRELPAASIDDVEYEI